MWQWLFFRVLMWFFICEIEFWKEFAGLCAFGPGGNLIATTDGAECSRDMRRATLPPGGFAMDSAAVSIVLSIQLWSCLGVKVILKIVSYWQILPHKRLVRGQTGNKIRWNYNHHYCFNATCEVYCIFFFLRTTDWICSTFPETPGTFNLSHRLQDCVCGAEQTYNGQNQHGWQESGEK